MSQSGKLMVWPSMRSVSLSSFCQRHANFFLKIPAMFHIVCVEFESNGEKCPSMLYQCSAPLYSSRGPHFPHSKVWSTHQRLIAMTAVDVSYS